MIAELIQLSNDLGVPRGHVREWHLSPNEQVDYPEGWGPADDHGLSDAQEFVDKWWYSVSDEVSVPNHYMLLDRSWLGIVHENGVVLVELEGRPTL